MTMTIRHTFRLRYGGQVHHEAVEHDIAGRPLVPGEELLDQKSSNYAAWKPVSAIDERDAKGADKWIPRNSGLMRLTGKHPFNGEPPHDVVMAEGMLTPVSMHFVRNHGAVPQLSWQSHRIHVTGLVAKPVSISMDDLVKLPAVTVTSLLACCSNRRKEVNMVKTIQGFNWGPGAVSVNQWTGARLADVLRLVGVDEERAECVPIGFLPCLHCKPARASLSALLCEMCMCAATEATPPGTGVVYRAVAVDANSCCTLGSLPCSSSARLAEEPRYHMCMLCKASQLQAPPSAPSIYAPFT